MSLFDHNAETCTREFCGRCKGSGEPSPPKPVDHDAAVKRRPMSRRELDLGRRTQSVGRRIEDEGRAASQHFAEWEREARIEGDSTRGGGYGTATGDDTLRDQADQRQVSAYRARWLKVQVRLDAVLAEAEWLLDQAKTEHRALDRHRTPAQVEAEGWCGSCWKSTGQLVPVTERPSGEPYYRGRCRFCGSWPGGDPPKDVLEQRNSGKAIRVKAS